MVPTHGTFEMWPIDEKWPIFLLLWAESQNSGYESVSGTPIHCWCNEHCNICPASRVSLVFVLAVILQTFVSELCVWRKWVFFNLTLLVALSNWMCKKKILIYLGFVFFYIICLYTCYLNMGTYFLCSVVVLIYGQYIKNNCSRKLGTCKQEWAKLV